MINGINEEEWSFFRMQLQKAFPDKTEQQIRNMINWIRQFSWGGYTTFYEEDGEKITKLGIKFQQTEDCFGEIYFRPRTKELDKSKID